MKRILRSVTATLAILMVVNGILFSINTLSVAAASTPAAGIAHTVNNGGYWIATQDGAVYSYGNAVYRGGSNGWGHPAVVGIVAHGDGGYWEVLRDGAIYAFGDAPFLGGGNH